MLSTYGQKVLGSDVGQPDFIKKCGKELTIRSTLKCLNNAQFVTLIKGKQSFLFRLMETFTVYIYIYRHI